MKTLLASIVRRARRAAGRLIRPRRAIAVTAATADFNDPVIAADPYPHYETLRRTGSVHFLPRHDAWVVLGYDDVQSGFTRPNLFSNRPYEDIDRMLLAADPPDHTAMRKVVSRFFTPDTIEQLDAFAERFTVSMLRPRMDIARDYGQPLSDAVTAELLGLTSADLATIRAARADIRDLSQYIRTLHEVSSGTAVYRKLIESGIDDAAARSVTALFWLAGTVTTERVIAYAVLELLQHDDVRRTLTNDHARIPAFLDEVLRLHAAELMVPRVTTSAVTLGGVDIPAGALVHLAVAAANRDPEKFEEPHAFRLDRPGPRHVTFGFGVHHCAGALLARRVIATSVRALLVHAPDFRAAAPLGELPRIARMTVHYLDRLPIETGR
ncbi:MAG TPA: cytochrome P450 [Thermoanaerobaculia bacterium]|jgi:cytochrome P450